MNNAQLKQYMAALREILNPSTHRGALCAVVERWVIQELNRVENAMERMRPPRQRHTIHCVRYTRGQRTAIKGTRYQDVDGTLSIHIHNRPTWHHNV